MDKTELRRRIREKKRAMTPEEIEERSRELGRQFAATEAYRKAKTIYGYMPYNQEVRTVPMLEQALRDGKKVAVPKCYGDEMKFIYLDAAFVDHFCADHHFIDCISNVCQHQRRIGPCVYRAHFHCLFIKSQKVL